jgi:hypothetical protein
MGDDPLPYTFWNTHYARGSFSVAAESGVIAAGLAAGSEIFQWRWNPSVTASQGAGIICVLRKVRLAGAGILAFAAGYGSFALRNARAWTVDGTGGTAISFSQVQDQKKQNFARMVQTVAPSGTGIRIASTAALGVGTKTLDTNLFTVQGYGIPASAGATLGGTESLLFNEDNPDIYPATYQTNEGFVIVATVPATGTWTFGITVEWEEFDEYN